MINNVGSPAVSKKEYITNQKKKHKKLNAAGAALMVGGGIALELADKNNHKDSFIKTIKSCAKTHTEGLKNDITKFIKYFTENAKYSDKIMKINNKKFFAGAMAVDFVLNYLILKGIDNVSVKMQADRKFGK